MTTTVDHGLIVERRMIVKGWKDDGYTGKKHQEFVSVHQSPTDRSIEVERARIGEEGLPDWQPHITEVLVEERVVTPWREVDDAGGSKSTDGDRHTGSKEGG